MHPAPRSEPKTKEIKTMAKKKCPKCGREVATYLRTRANGTQHSVTGCPLHGPIPDEPAPEKKPVEKSAPAPKAATKAAPAPEKN
jgi:predicted RNA-binding Zn-ribbon protein involved in translation (DUF1610 family)